MHNSSFKSRYAALQQPLEMRVDAEVCYHEARASWYQATTGRAPTYEIEAVEPKVMTALQVGDLALAEFPQVMTPAPANQRWGNALHAGRPAERTRLAYAELSQPSAEKRALAAVAVDSGVCNNLSAVIFKMVIHWYDGALADVPQDQWQPVHRVTNDAHEWVQIGDGEHAVVVDAWTPDRRSLLAKDAALLCFGAPVKRETWYPGSSPTCPWTQLKESGIALGLLKASMSEDAPVSPDLGLNCHVADWLDGKLQRQWNVLSALGTAYDNRIGRRPVYMCEETGESHNPDLVLLSAREALLQSELRLNQTNLVATLAAGHVGRMALQEWGNALNALCTRLDSAAVELLLMHANDEVRGQPGHRLALSAELTRLIDHSWPDHQRGRIARLLLNAGAPLDSLDRDGATPLARACLRGTADLAQILLDAGEEQGASVAACVPPNMSLSMLVASEGHWSIVHLLLMHGCPCPPTPSGERLLALARRKGRSDVEPVFKQMLGLALSASPINRQVVTALIDAGTELPVERWRDLFGSACRADNPALMEVLLAMRTTDVAPLVSAGLGFVGNCVGEAATRLVGMLLDAGAKVDERGAYEQTLLMRACMQGAVPMVKVLVARGASAGQKDEAGMTAQMYAVQSGHRSIVDLLPSV